ncbi:MAG: hypothetical protein LBE12_12985 [Planctomycetaceae bacterium]|nr:hypothetical protein [Planctomycetaceae bacterium]
MRVDSIASGIIAAWIVIRMRHYPLSTFHSQHYYSALTGHCLLGIVS